MSKWIPSLALLLLVGCMPKIEPPAPKPQAETKKKESLLKRRTQDIGKYDPNAGLPLVESDVEVSASPLYALEAYGPMAQKGSEMSTNMYLEMFKVDHDRYPTYEEFMAEIIKRNNLQLPVLPGKKAYQYDEENHRLVVVDVSGEKADEPKQP